MVEMFDRLLTLQPNELQTAWDTYKNFVRLTYQFRTRVKKLIILQDFKVELPDLYDPDQDMVDEFSEIVKNVVASEPQAMSAEQYQNKLIDI